MSATTIVFVKPPGSQIRRKPVELPAPPAEMAEGSAQPGLADFVARMNAVLARRPSMALAVPTFFLLALAWLGAFLLQFAGNVPSQTAAFMLQALPLMLLFKGILLWVNGVFRIVWAYVGIPDLFIILRSSILIACAGYVVNAVAAPPHAVPKSVAVLDGGLTFLGIAGLFVGLRAIREAMHAKQKVSAPRERVLIAGAGDAGEILLRELQWKFSQTHEVVGFVDDAPGKQGARLRGVPVMGEINDLGTLARKHDIGQLLIAVPSAGGSLIRRITTSASGAHLRVQVLPGIGQLTGRSALLPQLRDVSIEDLLRRDAVDQEVEKVSDFLRGKVILVTGAAGSIGSQLCRQILCHEPAKLIVTDWAETPLHDLLLEIKRGTNESIVVSEMGDVTDAVRMRQIFAKHSPDMVFHAAALKHVPMCESHVREAIRVNVGGTRIVAQAAIDHGVQRFVMISTDKAVNPSSVMGATKRVAEILLQKLEARGGATRFIAVRFGNVLGSNGSVIPLFRRQLREGGPLTVTHPEMRRYFMAIPEAVGLVLHAAYLGRGGDLFELDMGQPVKIVDLAQDLIRMSGLVPGKDVKIEFTGMRPGEKLFEELYFSAEKVHPTAHPRIFCLRSEGRTTVREGAVQLCLDQLTPFARGTDPVLASLRDELVHLSDPVVQEQERSIA